MTIAILTACPSGIANSLIAAGMLEKAAKQLELETVIASGNTDVTAKVSTDAIAKAELVILASDITLDTSTLVGKPVYQVSIQDALANPTQVLKSAKQQAKVLEP
ncbi:MAG: PTS fructose transporter subunit IIB, partial [Vibrio sp.]